MSIKYLNFKNELKSYAESINRNSEDIKLVIASKYFNCDQIKELYKNGQVDFGENRLQDALSKISTLNECKINWHFFGHVQTNKIKKIVENFEVIHSIDSLKVANLINKCCVDIDVNKKIDIFIQVNLAKEETKSGYDVEMLCKDFSDILKLSNLNILGLMIITPNFDNPIQTEPYFSELNNLMQKLNKKYNLNMKYLSMGMSSDWKYALKHGATHIRVGRALLG